MNTDFQPNNAKLLSQLQAKIIENVFYKIQNKKKNLIKFINQSFVYKSQNLFSSLIIIKLNINHCSPFSFLLKIKKMKQNSNNDLLLNTQPSTDKNLVIITQRLIKIFQKQIQKNGSMVSFEQKHTKTDYFFKIIDYFMLEGHTESVKEKTKNRQKYSLLKSILLNYFKISSELLEFLSEKIVLNITKGKFELNMVLHLVIFEIIMFQAKNISKSQSFESSKNSKKNTILKENVSEKKEECQQEISSKVKTETSTNLNEKQNDRQRLCSSPYHPEIFMRADQFQRISENVEIKNQFWSPYFSHPYHEQFYPQFYYYGME